MGLDAHIEVVTDGGDNEDNEEVVYWRKNNAVHGYFSGMMDCDNCEYLYLDREILEELLEKILGRSLEDAQGFFWGQMCGWKWEEAERGVRKALDRLNHLGEGERLAYYACY